MHLLVFQAHIVHHIRLRLVSADALSDENLGILDQSSLNHHVGVGGCVLDAGRVQVFDGIVIWVVVVEKFVGLAYESVVAAGEELVLGSTFLLQVIGH